MKKKLEAQLVKAGREWLEQFGIQAVNVNVFDEMTIDATTDAKSMKAFTKKAEREVLNGFRFVLTMNSNSRGGQWLTYTVYALTEKHKKLGWLTLRKIPSSTHVVVEIANEF
jgi:hypothetical protein